MNRLDIANETRLTREETELIAEIDDLSSYLRGIPAQLRESAAFRSYDVRLQQLTEKLAELSRRSS